MEEWSTPEWQAGACAWVDEQLGDAGRTRTGDLEEVRSRPWGVVLKAPTTGGDVYLKAAAPSTAFEAGLYELLARVVPDRVLHPLAVDVDAGWLLLPDGGPVQGEQHAGEDLLERLVDVVPHYAQMQLDLAPHVDELLAVGVADMRPSEMPRRFDEALEVARACALAHGASHDVDRLEQVARLRDLFARLCDELADAPGAPTLDHNDLHGGNVFGSGDEARFFDWGDAVVAHPFTSALVLRSVARWTLDGHAESPLERRLVDAYLEPFTGLAPRYELNEVLDVACEVGKVARALVWARAVAGIPPGAADPDGFATAPLHWMLELLEEPPH